MRVKAKVIIAVCMLAGMLVQAQETLPQGRWEVKQIIAERNTTGKIDTTVYNTAAEVKEFMRFPQVLEVKDAKTILLHYPNSTENNTMEYTLEYNQLIIKGIGTWLQYQYSINGGVLILTSMYYFVNNIKQENTKNTVETWTFTLNKQ